VVPGVAGSSPVGRPIPRSHVLGGAAIERGYGCLLPAGLFLGLAVGGGAFSEPSLGMVAGLAAGALLALVLRLWDRRRIRRDGGPPTPPGQ
jgi:hypothetical protein